MANTYTLEHCAITSEVYDSDNEEMTMFITADDGYEFGGQHPIIKPVLIGFDTIYLALSSDKKTASCTKEWVVEDYKVIAIATEVATVVYSNIHQDLTNCSSDCSLTTVAQGTNLTVVISNNDGFHFDEKPTATMNGVNVESSQLENGYQFVFNNIDGNIFITASCVSDISTIVNNCDYGFIRVYNPTQNEMQSASSKWFYDMASSSYVDLVNYIKGFFITYGKPLIMPDKETIKFGKYDTKVYSNVVREPVIEVDCGTITVDEVNHNALDYSPNSSVRIFLPFIGYENLDIDIVMNSTMRLSYKIDVLSGKCIAKISCVRTDGNFNIYTFAGNCSLQIPYYVNNGESNANSIVNYAYNLDEKLPYILIERAISYAPESSQLESKKSNQLAILGDLMGFVKCKEVNVSGFICTSQEKSEIESMLKKGVIL